MRRLIQAIGRMSVLAVMAMLILSGMVRLVSANLALSDPPGAVSPNPSGPIAIEELEVLIRQVSERESAISAREEELTRREQDLAAARAAIEKSLNELAEAEAALEARMFASDTASETDLSALTVIYEGMKPKDAAALFETMDPDFAAGFLARMSPDAAAAIFSNLPPLTAYAVSATIAGRNSDAATEGSR